MKNNCIECGKKKGLIAKNYAGLNLRTAGNHLLPSRIDDIVLPGSRRTVFLCVDCANKRKVNCSLHGPVKKDMRGLIFPHCEECGKLFHVVRVLQKPQKHALEIEQYLYSAINATGESSRSSANIDLFSLQALYSTLYLFFAEHYIYVKRSYDLERKIGSQVVHETLGSSWPQFAAQSLKQAQQTIVFAGHNFPDLQILLKEVADRATKIQAENTDKKRALTTVDLDAYEASDSFGGGYYIPSRFSTAVELFAMQHSSATIADFLTHLKELPGQVPLLNELGIGK